jgi:hypothetical protein
VAKRLGGHPVGVLPVPAGGWNHPFLARVVSFAPLGCAGTSGRLAVLDGIHPAQVFQRTSRILEYEYSYTPRAGLSAQIVAEHVLPFNTANVFAGEMPNGMVFPTSMSILPDGKMVIADTLTGTLWTSGESWDDWFLSIAGAPFGAVPFGGGTVTCEDGSVKPGFVVNALGPDGQERQYPYSIHALGGIALEPGLHGSAYINATDEVAWNIVAHPGGIWAASRAVVEDRTISPFLKPYRAVITPINGVTDWVAEIEYDSYHPTSRWLYFQRAVAGYCSDATAHPYCAKNNPLYRVDIYTGAIEFVREDLSVWDFVSNNNILPPFGHEPVTYITSNNTRQELWSEPNACLTESILFAPTRAPVIAVIDIGL